MTRVEDIVDVLAGLTLFGDLSRPQLEAVAHTFEEQMFGEGERILRQGIAGSSFYVITEGEAVVRIDGVERNRLSRGDFFGEISILLGETPSADVVATSGLRCLMLPGSEVRDFLIAHPTMMFRMLQAEARRLRNSNQWRD